MKYVCEVVCVSQCWLVCSISVQVHEVKMVDVRLCVCLSAG